MLKRSFCSVCLSVASLLVACEAVHGQNAPATGQKPVVAKPHPAGTADSGKKENKAAPVTTKGVQDDLGPKPEKNPAVLTVMEMERKTPADYVQSVLLLIDLGRPELAKPILADLAKQQITDTQRQQLVEQFGSAGMLKLSQAKELAPEGATFAEACMAAAAAAATNPQRIAGLIKDLTDPSAETRLLAQHDLAAIGPKAASATLETFAKETNRDHRAALAAGIAGMRPAVDRMLLAMLDTHDTELYADVTDLLRKLEVHQAAPLVARNEGSPEQAIAAALSSYERGTPVFVPDADNQVELWQWNDVTKQLTSTRVPADEARTVWISKLARMLTLLQPNNTDYQRQALVLAWEAETANPAVLNWPVNPRFVAQAEPHFLDNVLSDALNGNHPRAAVHAIQALAERRDPSVLLTVDGKPSPLAAALLSPNRRVRFAALTAIMALDPTAPFPGSSNVPEALAWFADGAAESRVLVAMPTIAAASDLAGQLTAHKLIPAAMNNGRELLTMARTTPDIDAILVDYDTLLPPIREVLYQLRTNPTTGEVPIAILAADGRLEAAKRVAEQHQRVIAVPRPHTDQVLTSIVQQLAKLAGRDTVPANERAAQANQARQWLAKLESGVRPFYVIRRTTRTSAPPARNESETLPPQP